MIRPNKSFTASAAIAVALAVPLSISAAGTAYAHPGHDDHQNNAVTLRLDSAKGSNASGTATLTPADGGLKVHVQASGMVPDMPHAQHIHGDTSGRHFTCPTPAADADDSGFLSVEEGLPDYGDIHVSLTTTGDTTKASGLAVDRMPVADGMGNLTYERTLTRDELPPGTIENLSKMHIVQHGVDANDNNKYDLEGLGESTFAQSLGVAGIPAEATDVATCGMIMPHGGVETGGAAGPEVNSPALLGLGGALLAGAAALFVVRRRPTTD